MHVDVLSSVPARVLNSQASQQDNTIVKTILQNIEVLSAGINIQKDAEGKPQQVQVVNLLVTPIRLKLSAWPAPAPTAPRFSLSSQSAAISDYCRAGKLA